MLILVGGEFYEVGLRGCSEVLVKLSHFIDQILLFMTKVRGEQIVIGSGGGVAIVV